MLKLNLQKLFRLHGIQNPGNYLFSRGISNRGTAYNLAGGKVKYPNTTHIEALCKIFDCTPNDLFEWTPRNEDEKQLRLNELAPKETPDVLSTLRGVHSSKIIEFSKKIEELKKTSFEN